LLFLFVEIDEYHTITLFDAPTYLSTFIRTLTTSTNFVFIKQSTIVLSGGLSCYYGLKHMVLIPIEMLLNIPIVEVILVAVVIASFSELLSCDSFDISHRVIFHIVLVTPWLVGETA
jgi:hypothetical protein